MLSERDWVMRVVQQLAQFIARALKLADASKRDEAIEVLREGCAGQLGMEYEVLAMLDAEAAVDLLAEPQRAVAFAQVVEAMAEVEARCHEPLRAEARRRHADELAEVIARRWPGHAAVETWLGSRRPGA